MVTWVKPAVTNEDPTWSGGLGNPAMTNEDVGTYGGSNVLEWI